MQIGQEYRSRRTYFGFQAECANRIIRLKQYIDEHYIDRVKRDLNASFEAGNGTEPLPSG